MNNNDVKKIVMFIPLSEIPADILKYCHLNMNGNHTLILKTEVVQWCKENGIKYRRKGTKEYYEGYYFDSDEAVMAFKLRWFGGSPPISRFGLF